MSDLRTPSDMAHLLLEVAAMSVRQAAKEVCDDLDGSGSPCGYCVASVLGALAAYANLDRDEMVLLKKQRRFMQ